MAIITAGVTWFFVCQQRVIKASYILCSDASAYPNGIPEVYMQWRLQRRLPVRSGFLSVSLGPRPGELMSVAATGASTGLVMMMDGILRSPSNDRYEIECLVNNGVVVIVMINYLP